MAQQQPESNGSGGKLRMLCLHGYLQTGDSFRMRIGSMRKALKSRVEFLFMDAPFHVDSLSDAQLAEVGGGQGGRSWFQWTQHEGPANRPSRAVTYHNWEVTYAALCAALVEQRPDGLLGFSQGGAAVSVFLAELLTAQQQGRDLHVPLPKFAVVVAGFLPRDPKYAELIRAARPAVPTLFVGGSADRLITLEQLHELSGAFDPSASEVYEHPGAHMVPTCTGDFKQRLCAFLDGVRGGAPAAGGSSATSLGSLSAGSALGSMAGSTDADDGAAAAAEEQLEALEINAC